MAESNISSTRPKVAAAVDFGTHGTGFAWTEISDYNDDPKHRSVHLHTSWQGQEVAAAKTLTAVLVDKRDTSVVAWGHEARRQWLQPDSGTRKPNHQYYESFKLALRPNIAEKNFSHLPQFGPQAVEIIALYLREIYRAAVQDIADAGYSENDITWCITVPAIWSDHEKQQTRQAAQQAGFPADSARLRLAYEPEAAALACRVNGLRAPGGAPAAGLVGPGSRFTVVDCGGGTVDITSYLVGETGHLEQVGQVCGGELGSRRLNIAFVDRVLKSRFGGEEAMSRILARNEKNVIASLVDKWEIKKHHARVEVTGDSRVRFKQPLYVSLSKDDFDALSLDIQDLETRLYEAQGAAVGSVIMITEQELEAMFEEVVPEIIAYVDEQLNTVKAQLGASATQETVLLVGGFAQSEYLQHRLLEHLRGTATVLIPADRELAVLTGAVHFCYDPTLIRARRSRFTYGYETYAAFDEEKDPKDLYHRSGYGEDLCKNRFIRLVEIGQIVPSDHRIEKVVYPTAPGQKYVGVRLYGTTDLEPRYITGHTFLGTVTADVSSTVEKPESERRVILVFTFGGTEISCTAKDEDSAREFNIRISFAQDTFQLPDKSSEINTAPPSVPKKRRWFSCRRRRAIGDSK